MPNSCRTVAQLALASITVFALTTAILHAGDRTETNKKIDDILTRLEQAGQSIKDLHCDVTYTEVNPLVEDKFDKTGEIHFVKESDRSRFLVRFDKTIQEGAVTRKKEWHLFDGIWYTEARESTKQIIKRQVVREGEQIDPFEIGKGPFPLPFGQKKKNILDNFIVTLLPAKPSDPKNTDHLRLIPKTESELAKRYKKIEMWIDRDEELPTRIFAQNFDDDKEVTATFAKLERNTGFRRSVFNIKAIKGWPETIEKLEP